MSSALPALPPTEREVYDDYLGYIITVLSWARAGKEIPLDQLVAANNRIRLAKVFLGQPRVQIRTVDLQAHHELFEIIAGFRWSLQQWEDKVRVDLE